jgi:hypothetical protein
MEHCHERVDGSLVRNSNLGQETIGQTLDERENRNRGDCVKLRGRESGRRRYRDKDRLLMRVHAGEVSASTGRRKVILI